MEGGIILSYCDPRGPESVKNTVNQWRNEREAHERRGPISNGPWSEIFDKRMTKERSSLQFHR